MSETRAISTTSRRELLSSFFFLQGKAPKEIHAILKGILACFLPGRAKDLSPPLQMEVSGQRHASAALSQGENRNILELETGRGGAVGGVSSMW